MIVERKEWKTSYEANDGTKHNSRELAAEHNAYALLSIILADSFRFKRTDSFEMRGVIDALLRHNEKVIDILNKYNSERFNL